MKIEDLNLSALKYFLDAVELQSVTLSAAKNHVSRPAVSQAILRLEQWYGKELLIHEKRRFGLTNDGKLFYQAAKKNFEIFKTGFTGVVSDTSLKIGCSASLIDLVFPPYSQMRREVSSSHGGYWTLLSACGNVKSVANSYCFYDQS